MSEAPNSRKYRRTAFLLAASTAFAGCTVGPNYKEPEAPVQTNFSTATTQPAAAATQPTVAVDPAGPWWTSFNDPTLNRLIDEAVNSNLNLRAAEARIREARAERGVVSSGYWPSVDASGSYTRARSSQSVGSGGGAGTVGTAGGGTGGSGQQTGGVPVGFGSTNSEHSLWQGGFDAAWELDIFGGVRRGVEAANASIQAAEADRNDVLLTLLGEVARNYVELRGAQRQLTIAQENADAQRQTLQLTQAKLRAGLTNDLDVARSEAQVSSTESTIPTFQTAVEQSIHRLSVLLGKPPAALLEELGQPAPIPAPPPEVPVGLPTELLRRRPDVRRAERQLAASVANIGVATSDLFPKFTLTGGLGLQSSKLANLGDSSSAFWSISPGVRLPIFNAGQLRSNVAVQQARADEALANYENSVLLALQEVEDALVAYQKEFERRRILVDSVNSNRRAVSLSTQLYQRGLTNFLDVLDAQRALYLSEDTLVRSDAQVSANAVALLKALGGGWNVPPAGTQVAAK